MALQFDEVVVVERRGFQPLDRAEEEQLPGEGFPGGADDVDLDVVAARPVAAYCRCRRDSLSGQPGWRITRPARVLWLGVTMAGILLALAFHGGSVAERRA